MAALLVDSGAGTAKAAFAADLGGAGGGGGGSGGAAAGAGATASRQGEFRREPTAAGDAAREQRVADLADPDFDRRHARWAVPSAAAGRAPPPVPGRVNGGAIGRPHPHSPAAAAAAAAAPLPPPPLPKRSNNIIRPWRPAQHAAAAANANSRAALDVAPSTSPLGATEYISVADAGLALRLLAREGVVGRGAGP